MPGGLYYHTVWTGPFPVERVSGYVLLLTCFIQIPVFNANSVEPGQTTASDLGLHRLSKSLLWDAIFVYVYICLCML